MRKKQKLVKWSQKIVKTVQSISFLQLQKKISQLLEGDIDSLKLPKIITKLLKTLKAIVGLLKLKDAKNKGNAKGKKAT